MSTRKTKQSNIHPASQGVGKHIPFSKMDSRPAIQGARTLQHFSDVDITVNTNLSKDDLESNNICDILPLYNVYNQIVLLNKEYLSSIINVSNLTTTFLNFDCNRDHTITDKLSDMSPLTTNTLIPFNSNILMGTEIFADPKYIRLPMDFKCICYKQAHKKHGKEKKQNANLSTISTHNSHTPNTTLDTGETTHNQKNTTHNKAKKDRTHLRGQGRGSIFIAIKDSIRDQFEPYPTINSQESPFYDWIIHVPTDTIIGVVYVPPYNKNLNHCDKIYELLIKDCNNFDHERKNILIHGDFNAKIGDAVGDIHQATQKTKNDFKFINFIEKYDFINLNAYYANSIYTRKKSQTINVNNRLWYPFN